MNRFLAIVAASVAVFSVSTTHAAVQVGQQAKLSYKTVDGKAVDVEKMHGKILVVDFWATWCGPCMAEAGHMVSINEKYGSKGLQMLGISLDSNKEQMLSVAKSKGFVWPQYFDGKGWENDLWKQWGESGIPFTVLVDANGKVAYAGHPAGGLDAAIETAFKTTPPFVVDPQVIADALKVLDQVEIKLESKDARGALKLLTKVPASANTDEKFAERSKNVQKKLEEAAEGLLADTNALVAAGSYPDAIKSLRSLADGLQGLPAGAKAKSQLGDLLAKPEVKAAIAKADQDAREAERNVLANTGLAAAQKLQAESKHALAYARYKQVVAEFSGTAAALTAADQVTLYDKEHPELSQGEKDAAIGAKARAALSIAESYANSGSLELAKSKYRSIIANYPHTPYADQAKNALARLGG